MPPDWDGWYRRGGRDEQWTYGRNLQAATMISVLTPEYQQRMTQMNYHEAVTNAPQWMAAFCYPEGLMRWWAEFSLNEIEVLVTPHEVQLTTGVADNFIRKILIDQQHTMKVPQWYGESVGFWDGNKLVVWTANVQAWTLSHSMFEFSDKLEVVEVFTPTADGGLSVDATFYDPKAFKQPLHVVTPWNRTGNIAGPNHRYTYVECRVQSTIVNDEDGRPTQLTPTDDGLHRLLRPAVGGELGEALRAGLGEAADRVGKRAFHAQRAPSSSSMASNGSARTCALPSCVPSSAQRAACSASTSSVCSSGFTSHACATPARA